MVLSSAVRSSLLEVDEFNKKEIILSLLSTILTSPGRVFIWTGMEEKAMSSMMSWFLIMWKMLSIASPEWIWMAAGGVDSGTCVWSLSCPCWSS